MYICIQSCIFRQLLGVLISRVTLGYYSPESMAMNHLFFDPACQVGHLFVEAVSHDRHLFHVAVSHDRHFFNVADPTTGIYTFTQEGGRLWPPVAQCARWVDQTHGSPHWGHNAAG